MAGSLIIFVLVHFRGWRCSSGQMLMNQSEERKGCTPRMRKQICFRLTLPLYSVEFLILVTMATLALDTTLRNCIIERDMLHWRHDMFKFSGKQRILEVHTNERGIYYLWRNKMWLLLLLLGFVWIYLTWKWFPDLTCNLELLELGTACYLCKIEEKAAQLEDSLNLDSMWLWITCTGWNGKLFQWNYLLYFVRKAVYLLFTTIMSNMWIWKIFMANVNSERKRNDIISSILFASILCSHVHM